MSRNICLLLFWLVTFYSSSAQDCTPASLLQKTGVWKASPKGSEGGTATDIAREKKLIAAIHDMVRSKYTPAGVEANYHGAYSADANMPGNNFTYSIIPLNYYCENGVAKIAHETSTYFSIAANFFDAEIYEPFNVSEASSGVGFYYIQDMPVEKNGYWYFREKDAGLGFGMTGKSSAWLITYNGKLPFAYVTKKEFLQTQKLILATAKRMSAAGYTDVLSRIEMEKGFKEKEYKNDPEKLSRYMKMDYNEVKARYQKLLADNEKNFAPVFSKIESQLQLSEAELSQPAIVKKDPNSTYGYLFTDDNDPMGQVLIKPNPGYFNRKLPRSSPQFFWIFLRGNHKEAVAAKFMEDIMKAVDFGVLRGMLGK